MPASFQFPSQSDVSGSEISICATRPANSPCRTKAAIQAKWVVQEALSIIRLRIQGQETSRRFASATSAAAATPLQSFRSTLGVILQPSTDLCQKTFWQPRPILKKKHEQCQIIPSSGVFARLTVASIVVRCRSSTRDRSNFSSFFRTTTAGLIATIISARTRRIAPW